MPYDMNFFLSVTVLICSLVSLYLIFKKQLRTEAIVAQKRKQEHLELSFLLSEVKEILFRLTTTNFENALGSKEIYERELNKRVALKKALKGCSNGSYEDKSYIIDFISDVLIEYLIKEDEIDAVMHFTKPRFLSAKDMFDILLYHYWKKYEAKGLEMLIDEERWDIEQQVEGEDLPVYIIQEAQVKKAFLARSIALDYQDKIHVVSQRIYEMYKGFGVVDKLRDMAIDGVSGGVSGLIDVGMEELKNYSFCPHNYDSVWIFYKGKSIHLPFLSFGSDRELKRVCQGIYRYNKAGQLSEDIGYKVNEMKDGSRVVVVRPPFSESWAFFVRKFHLKNIELDHLIIGENAHIVTNLLKFLMKGGRITSITGSQGSGKTTLLMSMIRHIYPTLTLRVQEMAFELHLRKIYPMRNILTFKETETISGQAGLDLQKKTDGAVNILGEIATDEISVLMLQMAQVASLFTVFTHHGKTVSDLILSLRNSLLKCNVFRDEVVAEEQVVRVLNFDVHLNKDYKGNRYIERITEIVPIKVQEEYDKKYREVSGGEAKMAAFLDTVVQYFEKRTERKVYEEKVIVEYKEGVYYPVGPISINQVQAMCEQMTTEDQVCFKNYLTSSWGEACYAHSDNCF